MRGQSGIGTIIVFIAMILAAVVVAIVILQVTESLRGQAMLSERQARETMSARFNIEKVEGIAYKDATTGEYRLYYLVIQTKVGVGAESLDWKKAALTYSGPNATIPGAEYVPVTEVIQENLPLISNAAELPDANITAVQNINGACSAELYNVMTALGSYDYKVFLPYVAPIKNPPTSVTGAVTLDQNIIPNRDPSRYTVLWRECDDKDDIYTLSDGQTAVVVYPLPAPLASSDYFTIDLSVANGWPIILKLRVPAGLDKGYVTIYPAS